MSLPGVRTAALAFAGLTALVVLFQLALAAGAPWGAYAMGGAYPGRFPPALRGAALAQAAVLALFAGVVLVRGGVILPRLQRAARWPAWIVVALSAVSLALNLLTPRAGERLLWAPVAVLMLASALRVAAAGEQPRQGP